MKTLAGPAHAGDHPPFRLHHGLAVYVRGEGEPLLLLPAPHACSAGPEIGKPLADRLVALGRRVVSFDPPGAFHSLRRPAVGMPEMLACAVQALEVAQVEGPVVVAGHSMASLCALGFALEHPERVSRLLLVGTMTGPAAALRAGGMPRCWPWWSARFWAFAVRGLRLSLGLGNLAVQERLCRQTVAASYFGPAPPAPLPPFADRFHPASPRARWAFRIRSLDYAARLGEIRVPTLVCAGLKDPQTTLAANRAVSEGITGAELRTFARSGHYPFAEEPEAFAAVARRFLAGGEAKDPIAPGPRALADSAPRRNDGRSD